MPNSWDLMDCSPPGSSVHEISQARILEWVVISFSREISDPGIDVMSWSLVSCIAGSLLPCGWILHWLSRLRSPIRGKELLSIKVFCKLVLSLLLVFHYLLVFKDWLNSFLFIYSSLLIEFHFGRNVLFGTFLFLCLPVYFLWHESCSSAFSDFSFPNLTLPKFYLSLW